MHSSRIAEPHTIPDAVQAAIEQATGVTGDIERAYFAAEIGNGYTDDTVEWKFTKGGLKSMWVRLPRAAFTYEREFRTQDAGRLPAVPVNFWLVEMARPLAEVFGIGEFVLDDDEVEGHKERMKKES